MQDDGDLAPALAAAQRGEEAGFSALWLGLNPQLLRYLRVLVGDSADDVASETWLQAARDLRTFRGDIAGFRVWLFRIARNRGIDDLRRLRRRREDPYDTGVHERLGAGEDAEGAAFDRLGTGWALAVITTLPPDQAEAVMLRVVAGLDVAQTAQVLGKRPGAVRVAAMRGLRRLATHPQVLAQVQARTGLASARPEGV